MAKVAFIGLGVMGFPMAGHLKVKGGHEVKVYNRTTAKAEDGKTTAAEKNESSLVYTRITDVGPCASWPTPCKRPGM